MCKDSPHWCNIKIWAFVFIILILFSPFIYVAGTYKRKGSV